MTIVGMTRPLDFSSPLPIDAALPELTAALRAGNTAVLVAPPGAGKTTRVPLVLAEEPWASRPISAQKPRASWCWNRGGSRRGPRPSAWPRRSARRSARRWACACASARRCRRAPASRSSPRACSRGSFSTIPMLDGVAAVLFDEFHERSLDADLGLALARDAQQGLREDLRLLVMSATIDGARVAKLLGDAPVIASEGRAFPVETRYLGRDPRADRAADGGCDRARGARGRRLGAGVSARRGGNPPHRDAARRPARCGDSTSSRSMARSTATSRTARSRRRRAGPPQDRAGDIDRRNLDHHRGRAHRGRFRSGARAALRARCRRDAARDRARVARGRRSAARPRRPHRARRLLPAVGRAADRFARAVTRGRKFSSADLSSLVLDLAAWGVAARAACLPRSAAARRRSLEAQALLRRARRHRCRRPHHRRRHERCGACRCRRGSRAWWSMRRRGRRRRRPPKSPLLIASAGSAATMSISSIGWSICAAIARAARARGARHGDALGGAGAVDASEPRSPRRAGEQECAGPARSSALAYPERIAKNRGGGRRVLARQRSRRASRSASPLAREPYLAVAEITGSAAAGRIAARGRRSRSPDIEARFADRIVTRDEVTFDPASASLRARRQRRLGAIALAEQTLPVEPSEATARVLARRRCPAWHRATAVDQGAAAMARSRHVPARRRRRRVAGPVGCGARGRHRLAGADARPTRPRWPSSRPTNLPRR